jgi:CHRD domain-containing protein
MRKLSVMLAVVALAVVAVAASVAIAGRGNNRFRASLDGYQEVVGPGSISTIGRGTFEARVNPSAMTINFTLRYTLENPATQAHIHFAQEHVGGGVIAFLCGGGGKPPCPPGTSGQATVTGVITQADIIGPEGQGIEPGSFAEAVRAMKVEATYVNVHSSRWPMGEIRGQISGDNDDDD